MCNYGCILGIPLQMSSPNKHARIGYQPGISCLSSLGSTGPSATTVSDVSSVSSNNNPELQPSHVNFKLQGVWNSDEPASEAIRRRRSSMMSNNLSVASSAFSNDANLNDHHDVSLEVSRGQAMGKVKGIRAASTCRRLTTHAYHTYDILYPLCLPVCQCVQSV